MTDSRVQALLNSAEWAEGAVLFTNWEYVPWENSVVTGIVGDVAVVQTQDALGFDVQGGGHANWVAAVRGSNTVHVVPGCRVAAVTYGTDLGSRHYVRVP